MKIPSLNTNASQTARLRLRRAAVFSARTALCCALWTLCLPATSRAAGTNLITIVNQGAGAAWTAAIWKTNNGSGVGIGTAVAPTAGNTYFCLSNGVTFGTVGNPTRIRNPVVNGVVQTFPGDSLYLGTNTDIRFKNTTGQTCNFPGTNGNPGLILDGGLLNPGDNAIYTITGSILVSNLSWLCLGNGAALDIDSGRGFTISAFLQGSDKTALVLFQATNANQTANTISGTTNTYAGQWIIKAGRLLGNGTGALGTNSITVDPNYVLASYFGNIIDIPGPAQFEAGADLNSAGVLTLTNGGQMRLHQVCAFSAVNIEGTPLSAGIHFYSELLANFPNSFRTGGSGAIVVRPYNSVPPSLGPTIVTQPLPEMVYAGVTARFSVTASVNGAPPLTFQWQKAANNVFGNLTDGGNISGSTNSTLLVSNVSAADATNYSVIVGNAGGFVTSSNAALILATPTGQAFETAVLAAKPIAYYELNETGDPATNTPAFDYVGGNNGTYGVATLNGYAGSGGIAGPRPADGLTGFGSGNTAASFTPVPDSRITVTPWNLNSNTMTLVAWINPANGQFSSTAVAFCRGGGTTAGLTYAANTDINGNHTLGYTWNNDGATTGWNSGIIPTPGQWWLVAMVITPSNATIYAVSTNALLKNTHVYPHLVQSFSGTTTIGTDSNDNTGNRAFTGVIDEVAVFTTALSQDQVASLYAAASGLSSFGPVIVSQPVWPAPPGASSPFEHQTVSATVTASGNLPLSYQWKAGTVGGPYTNLADGGQISGSTTATLTISNLAQANTGGYIVVVSNSVSTATSSEAALTPQAVFGSAQNFQIYYKQAAGPDWDTTGWWSDGNAASYSAAAFPGSTYEVFVGLTPAGTNNAALLRSPINATDSVFPGAVLTVDGNGVWVNNSGTEATIGEIRFKHAAPPTFPGGGRITFRKLVMNGGQLDAGDDGITIIAGEMDILTNTPMYNDGPNDRGYTIESWLTGPGTIEYHANSTATFNPAWVNPLNITGTSNTFIGKWNIIVGTLLGSGTNSLGTNDITIGTAGALETAYNVNNTNSNLRLNGRMFLHQNSTFLSAFINNVPLAVGTYTQAQLAAAYPAYFPTNWTMQAGSTVSNASPAASITVLFTPAPQIVQQPVNVAVYPNQPSQFTVTVSGTPPLFYQWKKNGTSLGDTANISGSQSNVLSFLSATSADADTYWVVATNATGSVTSSNVTLTILTPPTNITMSVVQPSGNDWDTPTDWDNGYSASASVALFPNVTFELLPGARGRPSLISDPAIFPGIVLKLDGNGVWNDAFFTGNGNDGTVSEFRFKHSNPGTVRFPRLIMAGGLLDNGDNGTINITGQMDVISNAIIYVTTDAGQERGYTIASLLTGNANIEYHSWGTAFAGDLNISGNNNTYSGTWHIAKGALLGSGANSLGTNSITMDAGTALETLYDVASAGTLTLDATAQVFLHQNNTFASVVIGGTPLANGVHSFTELSTTFAANFPATWTALPGSTVTTGSGQITVGPLATPPSVTIQFQFSGGNLQLNWSQGSLLEANDITGPWTTNTGAVSPYTIAPSAPRKFYRVQVQ